MGGCCSGKAEKVARQHAVGRINNFRKEHNIIWQPYVETLQRRTLWLHARIFEKINLYSRLASEEHSNTGERQKGVHRRKLSEYQASD